MRRKVWLFPRVVSEHVFDKLRSLDCTFGEFDAALTVAEVIEEVELDVGVAKELVLTLEWVRPLHVVVVVDARHREERLVTVYEPDPARWSKDYRGRR